MNKLADLLPGKISTEPEDLICYGFDASGLETAPAAIVWPQDVHDIVSIMNFARSEGISVIPRGAGTGMTGGSVPSKGSVILSFEKMNKVIEVDAENLTVLVEPGVINGKLQKELERLGLFYPPDPTSLNYCSIGGNVAENAGGPRALKYGVTRDYVMELEAVLPDGSVITTGRKTAKGVVGYDLTSLLVGSEGTLAVITKILLKVLALPEDVVTLLVLFKELEDSGKAVREIISRGFTPRTFEFLDQEAIRAVENYRPIGLPQDTAALLLVELDGTPAVISDEAEKVAGLCEKFHGEVIMAEDEQARLRLWEARRAVSPALYHLKPSKINEDIVVPRSRIPEMLTSLRKMSEDSGISIVNFGHAGDGNIHVNIMIDKNNEDDMRKAQELKKNIFAVTLGFGGTISGEHGIGLTKSGYIAMEIRPEVLSLMKRIKSAFDPQNILNPGKIFP